MLADLLYQPQPPGAQADAQVSPDDWRAECLRAWQKAGITAAEWVVLPSYRPELKAMDAVHGPLPESPGAREQELADRDAWREWFLRTWQAHSPEWERRKWLTYEPVRPWAGMLAFRPPRKRRKVRAQPPDVETEPQEYPIPQTGPATTSVPDLYWRMIPLYDLRHLAKVYRAMKHDLFVTSVFNSAAGPHQDPKLWRQLDRRFALDFRRSTRFRYRSRVRRQRVLEWTLAGRSINESAKRLIEEALHPLDETRRQDALLRSGDLEVAYFDAARRTVIRLRQEFREEGLSPRGRGGRRLLQ